MSFPRPIHWCRATLMQIQSGRTVPLKKNYNIANFTPF
jgi:hypothetical protein